MTKPTIQDTTALQQAFIALCGSYSILFSTEGTPKKNHALAYEILVDDAQRLIEHAQELRIKADGAV